MRFLLRLWSTSVFFRQELKFDEKRHKTDGRMASLTIPTTNEMFIDENQFIFNQNCSHRQRFTAANKLLIFLENFFYELFSCAFVAVEKEKKNWQSRAKSKQM